MTITLSALENQYFVQHRKVKTFVKCEMFVIHLGLFHQTYHTNNKSILFALICLLKKLAQDFA